MAPQGDGSSSSQFAAAGTGPAGQGIRCKRCLCCCTAACNTKPATAAGLRQCALHALLYPAPDATHPHLFARSAASTSRLVVTRRPRVASKPLAPTRWQHRDAGAAVSCAPRSISAILGAPSGHILGGRCIFRRRLRGRGRGAHNAPPDGLRRALLCGYASNGRAELRSCQAPWLAM